MFGGVLNRLLSTATDDVIAAAAARKMGSSASKSVLGDLIPAAAETMTTPKPFSARFGRSTGNAGIDNRITDIVTMSPDEYLKQAFEATDGRLGGNYDSWMASNAVEPATTKMYSEAMKRGDEFPLPYIDNALGSQDGRNRALAVKMAGGKEMPVGVIPEMTDDQALKYYTDQLENATSSYTKFNYQKKVDALQKKLNPQPQQRTANLLATHNISPEKLRFANETGGLAMPSLGVVRPNAGVIDGYGDITLVGGKQLVDPRMPGNGGRVSPNDMYSPRYPQVEATMNEQYRNDVMRGRLEAAGIPTWKIDDLDLNEMEYSSMLEDLYGFEKGIDNKALRGKELDVMRSSDDYNSFLEDLRQNLIADHKFSVWNPSTGKSKLYDMTADNALKIMRKQQAMGGEGFNYGLGNIRAKTATPFNDIDEIIAAENRLVSGKEFEKIKETTQKDFDDILDEMWKLREDPDSFHNADAITESISDYYSGLTDAFDYGYKTKPSSAVLKKLDDLRDRLKVLETEYFEAKPNRVVGLNEFNAAVLPNNVDAATRELLQKAGITKLVDYDPAVENARQLALQQLQELMF